MLCVTKILKRGENPNNSGSFGLQLPGSSVMFRRMENGLGATSKHNFLTASRSSCLTLDGQIPIRSDTSGARALQVLAAPENAGMSAGLFSLLGLRAPQKFSCLFLGARCRWTWDHSPGLSPIRG